MNGKILVAVSGSEISAKAVEFSIKMAKVTGWELVILHVAEKKRTDRELEEVVRSEGVDEWVGKSYLKTRLDNVVEASAPAIWTSGVRYSTQIEVGDPAEKVVEVANRIGAEMIVLGFAALKGMDVVRARGSVARKTAENSVIPVLVVPTTQKRRALSPIPSPKKVTRKTY